MATYIQTSPNGRIIAVTQAEGNPDANIWREFNLTAEQLESFNDYKLIGGQLVHDPLPPDPEAEAERARAQAVAELPQYVSDTDAALCELYEMQEQALADTDAALCELYELIIGE